MAAANYNITIEQGSDFVKILQINDSNDDPINITGYSFESFIKLSTGETAPVAEFTFTILNQTTNTGQVRWFMSNAITTTIPTTPVLSTADGRPSTKYIYDVNMTNDQSIVERILQGKANVSPEVTKE
jgi:hypothetical protein